jgi:hypothetical protein
MTADPGNYARVLRSDALDKAITLYGEKVVPMAQLLDTANQIAVWLDKGDIPR